MEFDWQGHKVRVTGNWTARWLFLAPTYELWLDDTLLDSGGGPRVRPRLEAVVEDEEGDHHHITAEVLSIIGFRPQVEVSVEGEMVASDRLAVQNFINPFLLLFILVSTAVMLYVGPDVLRRYF